MATLTKREGYSALLNIINSVENSGITLDMGDVTYDALRTLVENEIQSIDKKAESAKKRAEKQKAEGDELRQAIYSILTDDWMAIDEIVAELNDPDVTRGKVTSRLKQLEALEQAEKGTKTLPPASENGKPRKLSAYRKAQ